MSSALLGAAFSLFAAAELVYMTYHLDWTVFLFAHTIAEVLDLTAFVLVFAAAVYSAVAGRRSTPARRTADDGGSSSRPSQLAAMLLAAGCGGSGESSEPVATTEVEMVKSYRFDPKAIEIEAGETVTWTNEDNFTHTVQVDGQEDHKVEQGESVSITFDDARHLPLRLHAAQPGHGRRGDRQVTLAELRGDVVILACAVSAGIHGALAPDHFDEGTGAGLGFVAATVVLAALVVWLTLRPASTARARRGRRRLRRPARELRARRHDRPARAPPRARAGRRSRARDQGDRGRRPARGVEPALAARSP